MTDSETARAPGPLTRLLGRVADVEPDEVGAVVTAFMLFFCVLGGYFMVRPVRETVGTILGPDRVADLFMFTWIAAVALVPIYGALCARFRRSTFLPWIYGFVGVSLVGVGLMLRPAGPNVIASQFFFVFISVLNLFVVSVFWSFLLELFNSNQTKRLFGVIAAGGTAGALVGPMATDVLVGFVGYEGILFFGAGGFFLAIIFQRLLIRVRNRTHWGTPESERMEERPIGGNPFAGFTLILRSPYLAGIALFVILLASVNTFLYFEQMRVVSDTFADTTQRTRIFSRLDYTVQTLTIISQFVLTGRIAKKFGIGMLLTAVPILMFTGFLLLAAYGTFAVLAAVMITRRVGEYAFVRPGREMLYSRVDTESKYKAKMTNDVPVYRGGDAISAQVDKGLAASGWSASAVALLAAAVTIVWAIVGYLLGRARKGEEERASAQAAATA
ncbi:MAG TPA: MFS transporter [Longimicrobiales bacterium]|nr:MFS transporter [Longimicrobiales bacterium]